MASKPLAVDKEAFENLTPAQQRELRDLLDAANKGFEQNPLAAYVPYEKQQKFHSATERVRMFVGGNRAGKSTTGAVDDLIQALPPDFVPPHLRKYKKFGWNEPFKGRIITPDLGHTMEVIIAKFRQLTPRAALVGGAWGTGSWDKTKRVLRFENGSVIDFMSTEQDPDKFGGVDLHRVHYDEEPSGPNAETIWQESRWRLLDHGGDILLTMTPLFGLALVHDRVWEKRFEPGVFAVQASVWDNPHIDRKEIEEATQGMTDEERRARVHGEFVHFGGQFFSEFRDEFHVVDPPRPRDVQSQAVVVGIDPGLTRTGVIWVAFDNDNAGLAFAEYYEADALIPQVAAAIKRTNAAWGVKPTYVIDPSARNRATVNQEQIEAEYAREGIYCQHGQNARGPGILEVKRRLQQGTLVVSRECENLIWEFPRYRRDTNSQDEFAAIKQDDHLLDALRYVVMARAWTLPKNFRRPSNFNSNPMLEPPWRGPAPKPAPPLGVFS